MIKYDLNELRQVQLIEFEMLLIVDQICKKYGIKYTLCGGTLLGAVRHKGFIPWDDDLDIEMLRNDYEKFLEIIELELPSLYVIQNYRTDKECLNISFSKIRKKGTILESIGQKHLNRNKGICIDIFPIDKISEKIWIRRIHRVILKTTQKIVAAKLRYNYYNEKFPKKQIKCLISICLKPISIYRIGVILDFIRTIFKNSKSTLVTNTYCETTYEKWILDEKKYKEIIEIEFEGAKFPIIKEWDFFLKQFYGDYMKLPPENQRGNYKHSVVRLELSKEKK